jgi:hypothetical protein
VLTESTHSSGFFIQEKATLYQSQKVYVYSETDLMVADNYFAKAQNRCMVFFQHKPPENTPIRHNPFGIKFLRATPLESNF